MQFMYALPKIYPQRLFGSSLLKRRKTRHYALIEIQYLIEYRAGTTLFWNREEDNEWKANRMAICNWT
jgi:hypothetical protein